MYFPCSAGAICFDKYVGLKVTKIVIGLYSKGFIQKPAFATCIIPPWIKV